MPGFLRFKLNLFLLAVYSLNSERRLLVTARYLLIFILIVTSLSSQAAYDGSFEPRVEVVDKVPDTLYHWVKRYRLLLWATELEKSGRDLIFPYPISNESQFAHLWKAFARRNGVFTWTNPFLGGQGAIHESYSTNADLVMFEIKRDAKAVRLISDGNTDRDFSSQIKKAGIKIEQVQLVEHITPQLHEWIILNPDAIIRFTADPKITYPRVWDAMQPYLQDPYFLPPISEIHYRFDAKSKNPIWLSSSEEIKSAWSLSVIMLRHLQNFILNPESPFYQKDIAAKSVEDSFRQKLPIVMKSTSAVQCEKVLVSKKNPEFDFNIVQKRIQEFRSRRF